MKEIYNTIAFLICLITLGFIDINIKYSDKTEFRWVGWITRMLKGGGEG